MKPLVFFGDSITEGTDWNRLLKKRHIINMGLPGNTTVGFLQRLNKVVALYPKRVFIMGGINDIYSGEHAVSVYKNLTTIVQKLLEANITPVVYSTLFVSNEFSDMNREVAHLNSLLKEYCHKQNIVFINLNEKLSKSSVLIREYSYDGIHLNRRGYEVWRACLLENYETLLN